jgi:hypothetical protein
MLVVWMPAMHRLTSFLASGRFGLSILVLSAVCAVACAHPPAPQNPGSDIDDRLATRSPVSIDGDWAVQGQLSSMRISNGGVVTHAVERFGGRLRSQNYRVIGSRGPLVDLEQRPEERTSGGRPLPSFARRGSLFVISKDLLLFKGSQGATSLALRMGPAHPGVLGRYGIATPSEDLAAIEVGARTVELSSTRGVAPAILPILAASEPVGSAGWMILLGDSTNSAINTYETQDGKSLVELVSEAGVVGAEVARFEPATARGATGKAGVSVALPASGVYDIEGPESTPDARIEIDGPRWIVTVAGSTARLVGTATLAGHIGTTCLHVHLDLGPVFGMVHLDLRPFEGEAMPGVAFVVSGTGRIAGYPRQASGLAFRADAIPSWAPSFGFEKDIDLLCVELGGVPEGSKGHAVDAVFERVGMRATSDRMRGLCASALGVDPSMKYKMLKFIFQGSGRAAPTCEGVERLRRVAEAAGHREATP